MSQAAKTRVALGVESLQVSDNQNGSVLKWSTQNHVKNSEGGRNYLWLGLSLTNLHLYTRVLSTWLTWPTRFFLISGALAHAASDTVTDTSLGLEGCRLESINSRSPQTYCGWTKSTSHRLRDPGRMIAQTPTNTGFPWFPSGAKWILSIHSITAHSFCQTLL